MVLGLDIGGTKCAASLATDDAAITARVELATDATVSADSVLKPLIKHAIALVKEAGCKPRELKGIGVSCGGPLDRAAGIILTPPNLPLWSDVPILNMVQAAFAGVPVTLENDANATALAEHKLGAGVGCSNMAYITLGTGIGAGLILNGQLYRGAGELAGEVGHQTILVNGPLCGCGKRGCLEALASGPAIGRLAQDSLQYGGGRRLLELAGGKRESVTAVHVVEAAREGDGLGCRILDEAGTYLGIGIANLLQTLNLERVILGTLAVHAGDMLMVSARRAVAEYAWPRIASACAILPAGLGLAAQDMAAVCLALYPPQ